MDEFKPKPFGKYFLVDRLATGGMAEIYKAKTFGVDGFEKTLAIKRILPHCSADKEFINMLIDEAKLSVLLSHTNIVQVYDLGKVGNDYFISMEYINGINLREVLTRAQDLGEKIPEELIVYIVSEICKGLDYAHSKKDAEGHPLNIIHRDISPQNILLSFEGEVKIVDFGIAKAAMNVSHTMAGILKGKISYMSPEQALGKPIDQRTDIFSCGLILYELLAGTKFFSGDTQFEILKKIRTTRINPEHFPQELAEEIKKALTKALAYSMKDRYENSGDFQIDLTRYLYQTYGDFTPKKLKHFLGKLFAKEIDNRKQQERKESEVDGPTRSIMLSQNKGQEIVHREGQTPAPGPEAQQHTQTFMESFLTGHEDPADNAAPAPVPPPHTGSFVGQKPRRSAGRWVALGLLLVSMAIGFAFREPLVKWVKGFITPVGPVYTGVLEINSSPAGAQIFIDDSETNYVTPANLRNLELGKKHKITLKLKRHREWSKNFVPLDKTPINFYPTLEVIPVSSIKVASKPEGATIFLDGKDTGLKTPATLEDLPLSKTYTVKLALEKHRPMEKKITVYSLEPEKFKADLEKILYGSVKVNSDPKGAKIYLDGNDTGLKTPATIKDLEVGKRYSLRISIGGDYLDVVRSIELEKEGEETLTAKLNPKPKPKPPAQDTPSTPKTPVVKTPPPKPIPSRPTTPKTPQKGTSYAMVTSKPSGAKLFVNGVSKGKTPQKISITPGVPTEIIATKDGSTITRVITLRPGETRNLSLPLGSRGAGVILVESNPPGGWVYINGQKKKRTPLRIKGLRAGSSYDIMVKMNGRRTWNRRITIEEGSNNFLANLPKL